jgi:predicted secreted protein
MDFAFGLSVYFVVWWTVLFAILPLGTRTHWDEGKPVPGGGEPGSPVDPKLKRKFITTTWVASLVWLVIWAIIRFGLIQIPQLPTR